MSAIDRHEWILREEDDPTTTYRIIDGSADLDDEWSPLTQARLTLAEEPPNPLGDIVWLLLEMYQAVGAQMQHLRDISAEFGGGTIADITTAWTGLTLGTVLDLYDRAYTPASDLEPTGRTTRLMIRTRAQNADDSWSVTLESGESALAEYAALEPRQLVGATASAAMDDYFSSSFKTAFAGALTVIDDGPVPFGLIDTAPLEQLVPIDAGETLLNAVSSTLQFGNLRVVDFGSGAQLVTADWTNDTTIEISDTVSVIAAPTERERTEWFEQLIVVYSKDKTNPAIPYYGATRGSGLFPPFSRPLKTRTIEIDAPAPFKSSAQADIEFVLNPIADRMRNQGVRTQVEAVARYDAFPRCTAVVGFNGATLTGVAARVTFTLTSRTMTLDLRQVVVS